MTLNGVLPEQSPVTRRATAVVFGSLLLLFGLGIAAGLYRDMKTAWLVVGGLAFVVGAAWRPWVAPFGFLLVLSLLPIVNRLYEHVDIFPVHFHPHMIPLAFAVMVPMAWASRVLNPNGLQLQAHRPDGLGTMLLMFLAWATLTYLRGAALGNSDMYFSYELSYTLLFVFYFFWRGYLRQVQRPDHWAYLLLVAGVLTAVEFMYLVSLQFTDIASLVIFRVITRQSQVAIFSVPLAIWFFLTVRGWRLKSFASLLILLTLIHTFLTQQRSLWVAVVAMGLVFFTLYVFRHGFKRRKIVFWLFNVLGTAGFFVGVLFAAAWIFDTDLTVLLRRWQDVENLRDESFLMRVYDFRKAVQLVGDQWLLGLGGGRLAVWTHTGDLFFFFDNSYGMAYFKGGLPYAILMVGVYLGIAIKGFKVYLAKADLRLRLLGMTITTIIVGQMVVGAFTTGMLFYRFIFVWMLLGALATVLLERIAESSNPSDRVIAPDPTET